MLQVLTTLFCHLQQAHVSLEEGVHIQEDKNKVPSYFLKICSQDFAFILAVLRLVL